MTKHYTMQEAVSLARENGFNDLSEEYHPMFCQELTTFANAAVTRKLAEKELEVMRLREAFGSVEPVARMYVRNYKAAGRVVSFDTLWMGENTDLPDGEYELIVLPQLPSVAEASRCPEYRHPVKTWEIFSTTPSTEALDEYVAAAYRKAAEVCEKVDKRLRENCKIVAIGAAESRQEILALPHDDL